MLLIDGVKYELRTPSSEDELENMIIEHAKDIFGEHSIYLDLKQTLKSVSGIGSIPDGFAIRFGDTSHWHIIEVELSFHPLHDHIVSQVGRFISGIDNPSTQKKIIEAIYNGITKDDLLKLRLKKAVEPVEIYKFLSDLISKPPILTIIIEKATPELSEALRILHYPQIKVIEFQTFTRKGTEGLAVHAHLFEPLHKPAILVKPSLTLQPSSENSFEVNLAPSSLKYYYIHIPAAKKHLFPNSKTTLELDTDIGSIEVGFYVDPDWGYWLQKGLVKWFKAHPELKAGDKVKITRIEPSKKYHLEILK